MSQDIFSHLPSRTPPTSDGYDGDLESYPEIDFRELDAENRGQVTTDYLTHSLQKHPATFIPQIPSYLIQEYAPEDGGVVLDIFGGSGTTGVESVRQGHEYVGVEVNPLSKLISDVSTHPYPVSVLSEVKDLLDEVSGVIEREPIEFPGRTKKEFWFESSAREQLESLRDSIFALRDELMNSFEIDEEVVSNVPYSVETIRNHLWEVVVLVFANVVFEVSNADPGVSKAYKSPIMKEQIEEGSHPPDVFDTFDAEWAKVQERIGSLWEEVLTSNELVPKSRTILGDARSVELDVDVDVAISSPPYINAINYYRGSKLRLFWIADMLAELDVPFEASDLRSSIIGSNSSASLRGVDTDALPFLVEDVWQCEAARYPTLSLDTLDTQIASIVETDISDAKKKSYLVWKFFAEDMVQSMSRVYESLVDGGLFFFVIGENVVGGEFIETRKYLTDIGRHLGCFETSPLSVGEDFTHRGTAFDEITNRELFQSRNHDGGVIECEWVLAFER